MGILILVLVILNILDINLVLFLGCDGLLFWGIIFSCNVFVLFIRNLCKVKFNVYFSDLGM